MSQTIVVKLGGSVVSREDKLFDFAYMAKLRGILEKRIEKGDKFCLILGGGFTMRKYRDIAKSDGGIVKNEDLHWIGTTINVLHAEITRAVFSDIAEERPFMYEDYYETGPYEMKKSILAGGGGRAGHSGDVDAILMADRVGATRVISFKNIDYLYSEDPNINPNAEIVKEASWDEYIDIIGGKTEHEPGGNYVVDPIASRMAKERGYDFVIVKGDDLENVDNLLNDKEFKGSVISK